MNLLSWAGGGVKRLENTANNDILKPIKRDVIQPVERIAQPVVRRAQAAVAQVNPLDSGRTYNTVMQQGASYAPNPIASALQQATHNGLTNFAGSIAAPLVGFGKAAYYTPQAINREIHNKPINDIQQKAFGTTNSGQIARKLIGDTLGTELTVGSAGLGRGIEGGLEAGASRVGIKTLPKVISRPVASAITGAATGGPFNAASTIANTKTPLTAKNLVKSYKQGTKAGAELGAAVGVGGELAGPLVRGLRKLPELQKRATLKQATSGKITQRVPVNSLSSHEGAPDRIRVNQYKKALANGGSVEPLTVMKEGAKSFVADGQHRLQAMKELGIKNATIKVITPQDMQGGFVKIPGKAAEPPDFLKPTDSKQNAESPTKVPRKPFQSTQAQLEQLSSTTTRKLQNLGKDDRQSREIRRITSDSSSGRTNHRTSSNDAINPLKVNIAEVNPGDYAKARSNVQLASAPIKYAAGQTSRIARNLKLTTSKLGRLVEGTDKPVNGAEREAIKRYQQLANRVHATSEALGGNTPFRANYFHHEWDLSDPKMAARFEGFRQRKFGQELNPTQFEGLDAQPRVFNTVAEGEAAGFKLKNPDAATDILDYANSSTSALKRQALAKGFNEADTDELDKPRTFDLGNGKTIALSEKGFHEARAFKKPEPVNNKALKGYRGVNRKFKQTLLSASEFHPINITKKAAPALVLEGHPVLAAKGAYGAFRAQVGKSYSDRLQQSALEDGTVESAARIGTPIKFGSDYETEGKLNLGRAGLGERTIFEKAMPALHIRMVQAAVKDIKSENLSLDSPEARALGTRVNEIMGFVNAEVKNLDKGHQRLISDVALAPQFTRAKWATITSALKDTSRAGSYARSAVIGDTLAGAITMIALGRLAGQKSDNIKDLLIRALVHPSVPTPFKDSKGNTIELGMPSTYTSEALGLVANITRNKDGHLGITFKPSSVPGNLEEYARARLAILPSTGLKVATNTNFADKPLYDPNAPLGTKVQQGATTLLTGGLPIGLQGATETGLIKKHLPQGAQDVLTANTPGSNPILKSIASSFGLTPRTDKTVGKGLQTTQYYNALDSASRGLNRQEKDAFDLYTGGKKNPVTGKYDIKPSYNDARAKATVLLQNPKAINHLVLMNQGLKSQGQKIDPLWSQTKAQITKTLQYQAMPPGSSDKTDWYNKNKSWYAPLVDKRNKFFSSLPPGDPNKPTLNIKYPEASASVTAAQNQYGKITGSTAKGQFLDAHPEIVKQWDKESDYTNKIRDQLGYSPFKNYPEASTQLQKFMDQYSSADKPTRQGIRNANPSQYQNMIAYFDSLDLYNVNKQGAVSELKGEPDYTSKQAKSISSLAQDIYQNPDGTYSIVPAGWMNGLSNGSGYGSSSSGLSKVLSTLRSADAAIKPPTSPKVSIKSAQYKPPTLKKFTPTKQTISRTNRISVHKGITRS